MATSMKLSRIDIIGLNGNEGLHYQEVDILERLESSTKINGAYPKDIADAIDEIKQLRSFKEDILFHLISFDDYWDGFSLTRESYLELQKKYGENLMENFQRTEE